MKLIKGLKSQILTVLFLNMDQEFYVREIAYKLHRSPRGVLYELNSLQDEGILTSRYVGKLRFFKTNKSYPAFHELKNIIIKNYGIPEMIKKELADLKNIQESFIYGSVAQEQFDTESDIDLFVIGKISYEELCDAAKKAEGKLGREINVEVMTDVEYQKRKKKKDPYILDIEKHKKIYLIHDGKII